MAQQAALSRFARRLLQPVAGGKHWLRVILAFLAAVPLTASAAPGDSHWDPLFGMPGTATRNFALRFNGNRLYTSGYSVLSGLVDTNSFIYVHDGTNWSILDQINGGTVQPMDFEFVGTNLYVGGAFTGVAGVRASGLACWNGSKWSDVGGFRGVAFAMTTDGTNLYVGGGFTNAGGVLNTNLAKWNGSTWSALGSGVGYYDVLNCNVQAMAWRSNQLYIGGAFTNAGGVAATNLAVWNGASWAPVGGAVGAQFDVVATLQFRGTDLYVGGKFATAGGVPALNVAKWNGSSWTALSSGLKGPPNSTPVCALAFLGSDLYATGNFTNAGGVTASRVAKWDGTGWYSLGGLNDTGVRAVSNSGSIYFCGYFNAATNGVVGNHIIRFDGSNFHGLPSQGTGQGANLWVYALARGSDGLYAGGYFSGIGAAASPYIARWDGTSWNPLGSGISGSYSGNAVAVRELTAQNNSPNVYVGGAFLNAGGGTVNNIAMWDGYNWYPLGYGVDYSVFALTMNGGNLYVGGGFTNAYYMPGWNVTVNHIAMWDGYNWYALGPGVNGTVSALCFWNGMLYVGGSFTLAGSTTVNRVAACDGSNWYSLGTGSANGVNGSVSALLPDGANLYVGGSFTTAGTVTARGIAKWDGSAWSALGQGMFSTSTASVSAMAKIGSYLYAGGIFTNAGGNVVTRSIARWNGSQWQTLGGGVGRDMSSGLARVFTLEAANNDLYVGGSFETVGSGTDSGYIAHWNEQVNYTPPPVYRLSSPQMFAGNAFKFHVSATPGFFYGIDYSSDLRNWYPLATNRLSSFDFTNTAAGANLRAYRLRETLWP